MSSDSAKALRFVLMAGFAGMILIFLLAAIDAVRLLRVMRADSTILRQAALQRVNRLASIRSSILLTHTYLGDYFLDSDPQKSQVYIAKIQDAWQQLSSDLRNYGPNSLEEAMLVEKLRDLLDRHWQYINHALSSPSAGGTRGANFYQDEMLPLRTSIVEITTQIEGLDAKQAASTEAQIQNEFDRLGAQLSTALTLSLGAVLLLAAGCLLYIFRIERQNSSRYQEILKARGALEQLSARLVSAQEMERRTISRELHDQVGQTLNAVLVEAANLAKRIPPEDAASLQYLDNIRKLADSSVNSIRDIALLLRPSMLDDLGLVPALEWQAREVSRRGGIKVTIAAENVPDSLTDEMRTCVYRVVQEALQNVSRHSGAKQAVVTVRLDTKTLFLSVADNGRGFNPEKTKGLGMLGMEERVRQLGGQFEAKSAPGKGVELHVKLPLPVLIG